MTRDVFEKLEKLSPERKPEACRAGCSGAVGPACSHLAGIT